MTTRLNRKPGLSLNERIAARMTMVIGTMGFFWLLSLVILAWMLWNTLPGFPHVDTPPWYPVMLYAINIFQGLMLPLLMVGQQVLSRGQERREVHEAHVIERMDHILRRIAAIEEAVARKDGLNIPGGRKKEE